jgi:hypothetical protein
MSRDLILRDKIKLKIFESISNETYLNQLCKSLDDLQIEDINQVNIVFQTSNTQVKKTTKDEEDSKIAVLDRNQISIINNNNMNKLMQKINCCPDDIEEYDKKIIRFNVICTCHKADILCILNSRCSCRKAGVKCGENCHKNASDLNRCSNGDTKQSHESNEDNVKNKTFNDGLYYLAFNNNRNSCFANVSIQAVLYFGYPIFKEVYIYFPYYYYYYY